MSGLTDRLRALASFREQFEDAGFVFGRWMGGDRQPDGSIRMPWYELSPGARAFTAAAAGAGWVTPAVDWMRWVGTDEAATLLTDPAAIASATPEQLERVLTSLVRGERFGDGTLEGAWQRGILTAVVRRAAELAEVTWRPWHG
jgi:hypothetical protein